MMGIFDRLFNNDIDKALEKIKQRSAESTPKATEEKLCIKTINQQAIEGLQVREGLYKILQKNKKLLIEQEAKTVPVL